MSITWTATQAQRLNELDAAGSELERQFKSTEDREQAYQKLEKQIGSLLQGGLTA